MYFVHLLIFMRKEEIYDRYYCACHSGYTGRRGVRLYHKCEKKRREVHRMPGRRELSRKQETAEEEAGRPCDRKENDENLGNELRALCGKCDSMLNQIDGVRAEVSLSKASAKISYDREVKDDVLRNAVEKLGFKVTSIS